MNAVVHKLVPRPAEKEFKCSVCGVDAACNCGAPVISKAQRAAEAIKANPEKSDRMIAQEIGVASNTVRAARQKSTAHSRAVEDRPTIDKPPRGELWDVALEMR
jgi:hypothetical protein